MSKPKVAVYVLLASSLLSFSMTSLAQKDVDINAEINARQIWKNAIMRTSPSDKSGCFHISYPSTAWIEVGCKLAPDRPCARWARNGGSPINERALANGQAQTVGDGVDYVAQIPGLISYSGGYFPVVSGVTSETGYLGANDYTLQLNSGFMNTAVCSGHSGCLAWQQFIYSSGEQAVFMQYWLINYGSCPSGWNTYGSSCWKNSPAVSVPKIPISELAQLSIWSRATAGGNDLVGLGTGNDYISPGVDFYSITAPDSVLDLSSDWNESEFNIFGDGGGSSATFNNGVSLTVSIQMGESGGALTAPTCVSNAGTTGETNNLTLGGCSSSAGTSSSNPSISFTESN